MTYHWEIKPEINFLINKFTTQKEKIENLKNLPHIELALRDRSILRRELTKKSQSKLTYRLQANSLRVIALTKHKKHKSSAQVSSKRYVSRCWLIPPGALGNF
jgi:hypothetical protein